MTAMSLVKSKTLILATNQASVNQWIREIIDKTDISSDDIGGYTGQTKKIKPVTVATYQIMTWRRSKNVDFEHQTCCGHSGDKKSKLCTPDWLQILERL